MATTTLQLRWLAHARSGDKGDAANVGLIAMKTQGSEAQRDLWKKYTGDGKWTKHQAVLRLVWNDPRITAAIAAPISHFPLIISHFPFGFCPHQTNAPATSANTPNQTRFPAW